MQYFLQIAKFTVFEIYMFCYADIYIVTFITLQKLHDISRNY